MQSNGPFAYFLSSLNNPHSPLQLQKKVALPAVIVPTVTLHYGGRIGHQVQWGGGGTGHAHLGEMVWNGLVSHQKVVSRKR